MKNKNLIWGLILVGIYLLWKQGGTDSLRRDAFKLNKRISEATGGKVPVNRDILPDIGRDPGFGVGYRPDLGQGAGGTMWAGGSPGFYSGGANQGSAYNPSEPGVSYAPDLGL